MSDDTERWLPVVGYEGIYEVSSHGRVRSLDRVIPYPEGFPDRRHRGKLKKLCLIQIGYLTCGLHAEGNAKTFYVHRLVCDAFHGAGSPGQEVRHLNGNPLDNRAENLAWGTRAENMQDMIRHGRHISNATECRRGHPFDEANTVWVKTKSGRQRSCRICRKVTMKRASAAYAERQRQLKAAS